ncbi:hypothetical protein BH24DEI2_BH24DEI2_06920 [soil metagenome]
MRRLTFLILFLTTAALLAACAQPEPVPTAKTYTETELADFMTGMSGDWENYTDPDLIAALTAAANVPLNREGCPAVTDIFTFIPVTVAAAQAAPQGLTTLAGTLLARGTYTYDPATDSCTRTADTDRLVLRYPYQNENGTAAAELDIDWGDTLDVAGRDGELVEVPTATTAALTADGRQVATLNVAASWYNAPECGSADGILEPTSVSLSGNIGSLGFKNLGYSLSDTELAVQGAVTAGSDLSADLAVSLNGTLTRGPCFVETFAADSGSLSLGAASSVGDEDYSFRIATNFSEIVLADDFMDGGFMDDAMNFTVDLRGVVSVRLSDGLVEVDGDTAATFEGLLHDENANGTPGENVAIQFSGGGSTTLEAYLLGYDFMPALPSLSALR